MSWIRDLVMLKVKWGLVVMELVVWEKVLEMESELLEGELEKAWEG